MKLLMATCSDERIRKYSQYTIPILKTYAHKWNAYFKILDDLSYVGKGMWNYRTMIFYDLLKVYNRILYIDSDIIINKNCPNIFNLVPFDTIGAVTEDKGSRRDDRLNRIKITQAYFGNIFWHKNYFNMGFYIVSDIHRDIFQKIANNLWEKRGFDASFYSYQIMKLGYKFVDLGYKFNHMSMFSESWHNNLSRFDSYIIHYAGAGRFPDKGERSREQLIIDDVKRIYGEA